MESGMEYLTVKDIAEKLNVTTKAIISEIRAGRLRALRFGRRGGYRIDKNDLNSWIESKKSENK